MKNKSQKKISYFPKVSGIIGWFQNAKNSFSILLQLIKLHYSIKLIKIAAMDLLAFGLVYPLIRLTLGRKKGVICYDSFINFFCPSEILSLPSPLKSKIIMSKGKASYGLYFEIYIQDVYCLNYIKKGMNVIDIGANIGVYTVLAAEKVGESGKVIAIEPEPRNYKQLLKNININNFQNIVSVKAALTDHEGSENLYISPYPWGHSLLFKENKIASVEIPVRTLDRLTKELNLRKVDIIKIDAEGAEIPILKGAEKTLKANPDMKIIVAAEHYPSQVKEVYQFLNKRGFKTKVSERSVVMTI